MFSFLRKKSEKLGDVSIGLPHNYLFIDHRRLDMYYSQCIKDGDRFRFLTDVNLSISPTVPKLAFNFRSVEATALFAERTKYLIKYLEGQEMLFPNFSEFLKVDWEWLSKYEKADYKLPLFILERCKVKKVYLPVKSSLFSNAKGFTVWILQNESSQPPDTEEKDPEYAVRILLEDGRGNVESIQAGNGESLFSILGSLIFELRTDFRRMVMSGHLPKYEVRNDPVDDINAAWQLVEKYKLEFAKDPVRILNELGGIPVKEQDIRTLYQVIQYGTEKHYKWGAYSSLGYPIFIESV